ncbi:aaa family atpase [Fusarium phyllophilum]|uniref:Aaa family atpase n=1 Tax=Fusarium phyllophilum TaxID=47803 RepID=A0A8H5K8Q5_9HYPO|nr:aaa family atpase [Fusarium phyllophilum]
MLLHSDPDYENEGVSIVESRINFEERTQTLVDRAIWYLDWSSDQANSPDEELWIGDITDQEVFQTAVTEFVAELKEAIVKTTDCLVGSQKRRLQEDLLAQVSAAEEEVRIEIKHDFWLSESEDTGSEEEESQSNQSATEEQTAQAEQAEAAKKAEVDRQNKKSEIRAKLLKKRVRKLWAHLTISRDETAASDFRKEQLLALRSPNARQSLGILRKGLSNTEQGIIKNFSEMDSPTLDLRVPLGSASASKGDDPFPDVTGQNSTMEAVENEDIATLRKKVELLEQQLIERFWATYLDEPTWYIDQNEGGSLRASSLIHNVSGYLKNHLDTAFVVSKFYKSGHQDLGAQQAMRDGRTLPKPKSFEERIQLYSQDMITAYNEFVDKRPEHERKVEDFTIQEFFKAPYLSWHRCRSPTIDDNYGELYNRVEEQRKRSVVSPETLQFLIRPGDVVVWKEKKELMAVIAGKWPSLISQPDAAHGSDFSKWAKYPDTSETTPTWTWSFESREIQYDGSFYYQKGTTLLTLKAKSLQSEVSIKDLSTYPLERRLVSYEDDRGFYGSGERFMVDFATYEELHSDTPSFKRSYSMIDDPDCERMVSHSMDSDDPPSAPEIYIFPNSIVAYDLRSKKWIDLEVDKIREVSWDKKSFNHLVVDAETKGLVHALVINQIPRENATDIIDRKGNGLIILLHGGPGTGKTFTAESVAELAEKPLFRVTCGDIGTKPEDVEKYLESVLHLGKSWGCVVLLDEAEVFLEQQRLTDLERNALVSVFLRILEYYEGIPILTSNRVGTFDEAFKSRIQLSLHYENLTESQRRRVWKNFINRLESLSASAPANFPKSSTGANDPIDMDFEDIDCYLPELAKHEMNGRQICNAITTARQLAQFKGEKMASHHLRHVIKVSNKFDAYLRKVQDGLSDDEAARGYGIR